MCMLKHLLQGVPGVIVYLPKDFFLLCLPSTVPVIDWDSAKIVERERDDQARGIKEAVYIRILPNVNGDEGRHHLSHLYDDLHGANART